MTLHSPRSRDSSLERLTTAWDAFDRLLGGGLPVRSANKISGETGAGRTLCALQLIFQRTQHGKRALYCTALSEPSLKLVGYMQQFAFPDEDTLGEVPPQIHEPSP